MKGYFNNIERETEQNDNFRKVVYTAEGLQLVLMSIPVGGEIGEEVHNENDQFIRVEVGKATAHIDDNTYDMEEDDVIIVPRGARHNVVNASKDQALKVYTLYGPAHHKDGYVAKTKEEADASEEEFDGKTTE